MSDPVRDFDDYCRRLGALEQLEVPPRDITVCEHAVRELKMLLAYQRRELKTLEAHRQHVPLTTYREERAYLKASIRQLKLIHHHLLQAQVLILEYAALTDAGIDPGAEATE
jgi:hypothetical protein